MLPLQQISKAEIPRSPFLPGEQYCKQLTDKLTQCSHVKQPNFKHCSSMLRHIYLKKKILIRMEHHYCLPSYDHLAFSSFITAYQNCNKWLNYILGPWLTDHLRSFQHFPENGTEKYIACLIRWQQRPLTKRNSATCREVQSLTAKPTTEKCTGWPHTKINHQITLASSMLD